MDNSLKQGWVSIFRYTVTLLILLVLLGLINFKSSIFSYGEEKPETINRSVSKSGITVESDENFLHDEEVVILVNEDNEEKILPIEKVLFEYVEVIDGCGPHFENECLNVRSGPSLEFPVIAKLRNGIVLKVGGLVTNEEKIWYKVVFDEWLRYPERVDEDWYVSSDHVKVLLDEGVRTVWEHDKASTSKRIIVKRDSQKLYAYDGEELFMDTSISTGLELTPTPRGTFTVYKKMPSRYMQGPIPGISTDYYDLPGVPWNLYFTEEGAVIHGAYWHDSFGTSYSHGCVNLKPEEAKTLYSWAELGMTVTVTD